jgi:hypothetical protein
MVYGLKPGRTFADMTLVSKYLSEHDSQLGGSDPTEQKHPSHVSVAEAQRAIYIDFEGTAVDPPSFIGVAWSQGNALKFVQHVIEPQLWSAAEAKSLKTGRGSCTSSTWHTLTEIRSLAEQENRRVFAWSNHERDLLVEHMPDNSDGAWFSSNVENAIKLAKVWKRRHFPDVEFPRDNPKRLNGRNQLSRYLTLIGYSVPKAFGPGNSAQRIRYVREMLQRKDDYAALTPTAKAKWTKALEHNWHDCDGLRQLVLRCAKDLATT